MINSFSIPIQCEDNYVRTYLRPEVYYPNNNNTQLITFPYGTLIQVGYNVVLPCIAVCRPTRYEVENCDPIALTSKFYWDPYGKVISFYKVEAHFNLIELVMESFEGTYLISFKLSCLGLGAMISDTPVFHQSNNTAKDKRKDEDMYCTVDSVKAKYSSSLSPEKLSRMWVIKLKTVIKTLDATPNQCIRSIVLIEK